MSGNPLRGRGGCTCVRTTLDWGLTAVGKLRGGVSSSRPLTLQPREAMGWELEGVQLAPWGEAGSVRGSTESLGRNTAGETVTVRK